MADEKKIFVFKGSNGREYEVEDSDPDSALARAEKFAAGKGFHIQPADPSLFVKPGSRVPTPERPTMDPMALQQDADPSDRNMVIRNLMRFAPATLMGKPGMGVANTAMGMGLDKFLGEDHLRTPGIGELLSETASAALPIGAGAAEKAGSAALKKFGSMVREHPYLFGTGTGAVAGGLGTVGTGSDALPHAALGGAGGLAGTIIGKKFQDLVKSAPSIVNPAAQEAAEKLGYRPGDIPGERAGLQGTADTMKTVADLAAELEKAGAIPALRGAVKQKATAARTTDLMQAGAEAKRAQGELSKAKASVAERQLMNSRRFQELNDEAALLRVERNKYQSPSSPGAVDLDRKIAENKTRRDIHELLMTKEKAAGYPELQKARENFQNANQRKKALRAIAMKNKLQMRDEDLDRIALNEVADDVSANTGYDPRVMNADQKNAVKWLAQDHPEAIVDSFIKDESSSTSRVKGLVSLFGPKSKEVAAIKNQFVSRLFSDSVQNTGPFAGRGISGEKMGQMLSKLSPDALNIMFDNSEASSTLRGIEKLLVDAEFTRAPTKPIHFVITPNSAASLNSERGGNIAETTMALMTASGAIKVWQSIPKFVDAIMARDNALGRAVRIYAKNPTPGTALRLQTAAANQSLTEAKPEQNPAEPQ